MWGAEAEEEKEEGADTELKTKTPHVNVGNNTNEQDNRKDAWASIKEAEGKTNSAINSSFPVHLPHDYQRSIFRIASAIIATELEGLNQL